MSKASLVSSAWRIPFILVVILNLFSWSQNSRYVLTSSKDWNVIVWDLASDTDPPRRKATLRYDCPVTSASFHPRNRCVLEPRLVLSAHS